jgi:hypothetical protein
MRKLCVVLAVVSTLLIAVHANTAIAAERAIVSTTSIVNTPMRFRVFALADDNTAWGLHLNSAWANGGGFVSLEQLAILSVNAVWEQLPMLPEGRTFKELRALDSFSALSTLIFVVVLATDGSIWGLIPSEEEPFCTEFPDLNINLTTWIPLTPSLPPSE